MSFFQFKNNAKTKLAGAISNTDLVFSVTGGDGAKFPSSGPFKVTFKKADGTREIVEITSRSTDALTVVTGGRGQEGTTAQSYSAGDVTTGVEVSLCVTAGILDKFLQAIGGTFRAVFDVSALTANRTITVRDQAGTMALLTDLPPGMMIDYAGGSVPDGWLERNGQAVSRSTYSALFSAIGTTYGTGDGSTTFNVPDDRGRSSIGAGTGSGLTARTRGATGGAETVALSSSNIPANVDQLTAITTNTGTPIGNAGAGPDYISKTATPTGHSGSGSAHNNMPPFIVHMKLIKT